MSHAVIWNGIEWECTGCAWTSTSDLNARAHGSTGMERLLDALEIPD